MKRKRENSGSVYAGMPRFKRQALVKPVYRGPPIIVGRAGYGTVARTRGVYGRGEMKYYDTELGSTAVPSSLDWTATEFDPSTTQEATPVANPLCLFAPIQGAAINQRIGRDARVFKIKIRGFIISHVQTNQTAMDEPAFVRIALVQDMQTNATQAQGEQVFQDPTTNSALIAANTFQALNNFGRFRVLKERTVILQDPNASYDGTNVEVMGQIRQWKMSIKFRQPVVVRFNSQNGGTVADIIDNSFHILATCTSTNLAPEISYVCRVCFKE